MSIFTYTCNQKHNNFNNLLNAQILLFYNNMYVTLKSCTVCRMRADCSLLSSGILYSRLQRVTIPDAVIIQFVILKMGMLMLETCRGL